ncbi:MAG: ribonuclease J [Anaerolineales bacterium]|nr:ribonuclease J [Anaerolineales bacterium]
MRSSSLKIVPIGGLGEIGKNMMVYEYEDDILIVDTGIMFPENDMLGIDYIIPDFQYLIDRADNVRGIIITHGHEDHTGAIAHVLEEFNAPIYATPLTRGLLEVKLARSGLLNSAQLVTVNAGEKVRVGVFEVEFAHVCHSIPDGVALGINTPEGLIVHTGDYKFDHTPVDNWPTDYAKLSEWGGRGVLALLADSTNADTPGWTPSERVIDPAFDEVFRNAEGRILVASFASLISRMEQVAKAAMNHGRKMAFVGTSMRENAKMATQLGYLDLPEDLIVPVEQALNMNPKEVVLMCTGSQGEPTSIMGRLATGRNRQFDVEEGDTIVLSSHPIPGNEESVYRTINKLFQRGANVIYEPIMPVHVSGHASQEEMKLMLHLVRPKFLVPIHGELRHLRQHGKLAEQLGMDPHNIAVVENGTPIEFEDEIMTIGNRIPGGYVFVDGSRVGDVGPAVVRERGNLSRDGFVSLNVLLDKDLVQRRDPHIITRGYVYKDDLADLMLDIDHQVEAVLRQAKQQKGKVDEVDIEKDLEKSIRKLLSEKSRRRPLLFTRVDIV